MIDGPATSYTCESSGKFSGSLPACVANLCTVGHPDGTGVVADGCNSVATSESCMAGCAGGLEGAAENFVCTSTGLLVGTFPMCLGKRRLALG